MNAYGKIILNQGRVCEQRECCNYMKLMRSWKKKREREMRILENKRQCMDLCMDVVEKRI